MEPISLRQTSTQMPNVNEPSYVLLKDKCQSLTRLIVTAADDSSKLLLSCTLGEEPYRQLSFNLINLVLVSFLHVSGHNFTVKLLCSDEFQSLVVIEDLLRIMYKKKHDLQLQECTAIPGYFPVDECCSDLSFGFWYNLQVCFFFVSVVII